MRLHALLAFYDEPPRTLTRLVETLTRARVHHLIAVDGAYQLYPNAKAASPTEQHATLRRTTAKHDIRVTLHTPDTPWQGNEVHKRQFMFDLALDHSQPGDWWLVIDADTTITRAPRNLHHQLHATPHDVATAVFHDHTQLKPGQQHATFPMRMLFRAQPIHLAQNHYTYTNSSGEHLWSGNPARQLPALHLHDLHVDHTHGNRPAARTQAKNTYYQARDQAQIEADPCIRCREPSTTDVVTNYQADLTGGAVGDLARACTRCARRIEYQNRWRLRDLGINPDQPVRAELRHGPAIGAPA